MRVVLPLVLATTLLPRAGQVDLELTSRSSPALESLVAQQRFVDAFELSVLELGRRLAAQGYRHPDTILALHRAGTVAHLAGDQATAEDALAAALSARRSILPAADPATIETLLRRGRTARFRGDRERARACYDEAASALALHPGRYPVLEGELLQLEADWVRGDDEVRSIPLYERALGLRRKTFAEPSFAIADNETWLAWTMSRLGRRSEAKPYIVDAARQLDALGLSRNSLRATLDNLSADTLVVEGKLSEAEVLYRETARRFAEVRRRQWGGYPRSRFPLDGFDALALAALRRGDGDEAWRLAERSRAATHVDFATLGVWERRDPHGFAAWTSDRRALHRVHRRTPVWTEQGAPVFLEMLTLRARLSGQAERYLEANRPDVPSLEQVQRLLGPRQALVGWLEVKVGGTPSGSVPAGWSDGYAFVVRASGPVRWVPLWSMRSSADEGVRFRNWVKAFGTLSRAAYWPTRVGPDPEIFEEIREWSRQNVDPVLPLLDGVDHLVLERLTEPIELSVLEDGRLLGDLYDVSYVPSAQTLVLLAEAHPVRRGPARDSVLSVSGPTDKVAETRVEDLLRSPDAPSGHRGTRSAYRRDETPLDKLPRLRYARLEARSVASQFGTATVLDGNEAAAALARLAADDRLAEFRVVHVATHTLMDGTAERCALALADREPVGASENRGVLEVEDIALRWRLDADLMTLSGCETLRAAGAGRGEPFGFTPAIFAAGARQVLSSVWPVDDRATTILMARFYENYTGHYTDERLGSTGRPMKAARALREARRYVRELKDPSGRRPYEHPAYWAGFFLLGLPD